MAQIDVNVNLGDPGFYGQVDPIDNAPPPQVMYSTPVTVQPAPGGVIYQPVYLRVPPMYYQNWPQYCGYYNACYQPVFFVQENWYLNLYAPLYRYHYPHGRPGFAPHIYYNAHYSAQQPRYEQRGNGQQFREERHEEHRDERREEHREER
jgi:hypothetical protein